MRTLALAFILISVVAQASDLALCLHHANEVQQLEAGNYESVGSLENWYKSTRYASDYPALTRFIHSLHALPGDRRQNLLRAIYEHPPRNSEITWVLRLSLYEQHAWDQLFDGVMQRGDIDEVFMCSMSDAIRNMPEALSDHLLNRIGELYPKASKESAYRFPPKRSFDEFLRQRIPAREIIANAVKSGKTPVEALQEYAQRIRLVLGKPPYGGYDAEDVIAVARIMQKEQRTLREDFERWGYSKDKKTVLMFGSFPNFKAHLENAEDLVASDIDIMGGNLISVGRMQSQKVPAEIISYLKNKYSGTNPGIRPHPPTQPQTFSHLAAAEINPIVFEITPEEIRLLVYPVFDLRSGASNFSVSPDSYLIP